MNTIKNIINKIATTMLAIAICFTSIISVNAADASTNYSAYSTPSTSGDYAYWNGSRTVKAAGTTVSEIKWMQTSLNYCIVNKGVNTSKLTIDGSFGPACKKATLAFQKKYGLSQDGSFGPNTISKMISVLPKAAVKTTTSTANATPAAKPINYSLSGYQAKDIVEIAKTQVGYQNGANNNNCYGVWFGMNKAPWCAIFVSWCANKAGIPASIIPRQANADRSFFQNKGLYKKSKYRGGNYVPKCGDLVYFDTNGDGKDYADHVGIVKSADSTYVYTIEGNSGGAVKSKCYNITSSAILGYATPKYSK